MKKVFVVLGLLMLFCLGGGCTTVHQGHNFYRVDGYLGTQNFSSTEVLFYSLVPDTVAYISWGVVPLCVKKGGPRNTVGLSYGEKFSFLYNAPPNYGETGLSLSVEFRDLTESRIINQKQLDYIFPIYYRQTGVYNWNFWSEGGKIFYEIKGSPMNFFNLY